MKKTDNQRYNESIERLKVWLYENELQRRRWAHEKWQHPEGRAFKLFKIFAPILSVITVMSVILYCLIRDLQISMTADGSLAYEADTKGVQGYFALVLCMGAVILVGNALLFFKKYITGSVVVISATAVILFHIFTQINIPMPPDPMSDYRVFCIVNIVIYLALILICGGIIFILLYDKYELNRMVENTLVKIAERNKQENMMDLDSYAQLIDKYIDVERQKRGKKDNKK